MSPFARLAVFVLAVQALGCGSGLRRFPLQEPMWTDPDQNAVAERPVEYYSPFGWDAADQTLFRPISRFFAVDPASEAENVNSMDEVPDSSWFTNRVGRDTWSVEETARGACPDDLLDTAAGPWLVTDAKPNGANPGFIIEAPDGRRWLLKFDGLEQPERGTAADVIGSLIYYAAGYFTPCNIIVTFAREAVQVGPDAESEDAHGNTVPMTAEDLDRILTKATRLQDGQFRASASLFLEGSPIGPWRYQGTRSDDPNDVVDHEDRRDLRGMYVLASWLNHFDSREQNTLATWIGEAPERGYVRHHVIDFGDCFGSLWEQEGISRRLGHAYYLDIPFLLEDFVTLGLIGRPWDTARYGRSGAVFAYFAANDFVADEWRPGYPNPAFARMSERDAAWMARILAHFDGARLAAAINEARFERREIADELQRILLARRTKILRRWFQRLSPLSKPRIVAESEGASLCMTDLAVTSGAWSSVGRRYAARAFVGEAPTPAHLAGLRSPARGEVCATLPQARGATPTAAKYVIVDMASVAQGDPIVPVRVHLYHRGAREYQIVGLERPMNSDAPADDR